MFDPPHSSRLQIVCATKTLCSFECSLGFSKKVMEVVSYESTTQVWRMVFVTTPVSISEVSTAESAAVSIKSWKGASGWLYTSASYIYYTHTKTIVQRLPGLLFLTENLGCFQAIADPGLFAELFGLQEQIGRKALSETEKPKDLLPNGWLQRTVQYQKQQSKVSKVLRKIEASQVRDRNSMSPSLTGTRPGIKAHHWFCARKMHQLAQVVSWMQRLQSLDLEACLQETMQCSQHELSWFQMQQLWTVEGFCFRVLLVLQSHFMKCPVDQPLHAVAWSLTAQCHSFVSSLSPQKGCTFVFSKRQGHAEVFAVLWHELGRWTMPITQVQPALPQIPFRKQLAEKAWEPWERGATASRWCRCPESQV